MDKESLQELKKFFENSELPTAPIRLDGHTTIQSPAEFVAGHLEYVEANILNRGARPYYERLVKLRQIIEHGT